MCIRDRAYECGLYHDVGKSYVFMYIGNNYRRLLDEEFTCIQWHTAVSYTHLDVYKRQRLGGVCSIQLSYMDVSDI